MSELAIFGGKPAVPESLPRYCSIGEAEAQAVARVVRSGCLSGFYGSWRKGFFGGELVHRFEREWSARFGCKHTVSVNSATSGLVAAVGAAGVGPGDEVIVPPYTMSATAVSPLAYGAVPVFADIEEDTFCIDRDDVARKISPRTRAVIAVNLFGHPARLHELRALCEECGIILIEDNAQGPLAEENGKYAGTIAHIGVFSLNYHKHIHTGEGGMCCTDDDRLALRMQLIRNHAESVVEQAGVDDLSNMFGFNLRITEMSAAVGIEQLKSIDRHVEARERVCQKLSTELSGLAGITVPVVRAGCRHVYYLWSVRVDPAVLGCTREAFAKALNAEGFPVYCGYVRPLYLLPLFQKRMALGRQGFPFSQSEVRYDSGLCPVCERMHFRELMAYEPTNWDVDEDTAELLIMAFRKVHAHRAELVGLEDK